MRSALGSINVKISPPPMTAISSLPARLAHIAAFDSAALGSETTVAPGALYPRVRLMTILSRPGSGRFGKLSQVLRPMISGLPMVIVLKNRISEESFHGSPPSRPMMPFFETATTKAILGFIGGMIEVALRPLPARRYGDGSDSLQCRNPRSGNHRCCAHRV